MKQFFEELIKIEFSLIQQLYSFHEHRQDRVLLTQSEKNKIGIHRYWEIEEKQLERFYNKSIKADWEMGDIIDEVMRLIVYIERKYAVEWPKKYLSEGNFRTINSKRNYRRLVRCYYKVRQAMGEDT